MRRSRDRKVRRPGADAPSSYLFEDVNSLPIPRRTRRENGPRLYGLDEAAGHFNVRPQALMDLWDVSLGNRGRRAPSVHPVEGVPLISDSDVAAEATRLADAFEQMYRDYNVLFGRMGGYAKGTLFASFLHDIQQQVWTFTGMAVTRHVGEIRRGRCGIHSNEDFFVREAGDEEA